MSNYAPRQYPHNIGLLPTPEQGPRYLKIVYPFAGAGTLTDDLVLENENGIISNVQSIFVDTTTTDAVTTITFLESGQKLTIPPNTNEYYQILCGAQVSYTIACSGGSAYGPVTVFYLNVPIAAIQGNTKSLTGTTGNPTLVSVASGTIGASVGNPLYVNVTGAQVATQTYSFGQYQGSSGTSGNVAAAAANCSLPINAGHINVVTGFAIMGLGATAAGVVQATLSNVSGGPLTFEVPIPAGVTVGITPLIVSFGNGLGCTALSTAINLSVPSFGAGNTNACSSIWGYYG